MPSKGALDLIADYGGDSSDEEVPGCRVSTKRMHKDDDEEPNHKRFERLPVPNFKLVNTHSENVVDDPSMHEGRIRNFGHERGNWATYVYIPFESTEGLQQLSIAIKKTISDEIELKFFSELHISLTRTVVLKHHWIDSFVVTLKENLSPFTRFIVMLDSMKIYCNEEKTRTFIGLQIKTGVDSLTKLVHTLDNCLGDFKLPKFYENPSFHISIAWCLGDQTERLGLHLSDLNSVLHDVMDDYSQENWYIYVEHILCRIGNKLFQFNLT